MSIDILDGSCYWYRRYLLLVNWSDVFLYFGGFCRTRRGRYDSFSQSTNELSGLLWLKSYHDTGAKYSICHHGLTQTQHDHPSDTVGNLRISMSNSSPYELIHPARCTGVFSRYLYRQYTSGPSPVVLPEVAIRIGSNILLEARVDCCQGRFLNSSVRLYSRMSVRSCRRLDGFIIRIYRSLPLGDV